MSLCCLIILISLILSFYSYGAHRDLHSFPTRRSSDLTLTSQRLVARYGMLRRRDQQVYLAAVRNVEIRQSLLQRVLRSGKDRKSTRLNSSHSQISYAVFCLKKKKNIADSIQRMPPCNK